MTNINRLQSWMLTASLLVVGAASAQGDIIQLSGLLSGPAEAPPNASPGTGWANVSYDDGAHTLRVQTGFWGLIGTTTASHIHAATAAPFTGAAGVATQVPTFIGFPLGVRAGTYDHTLDLTQSSSFNPAFVTAQGSVAAAETALISALLEGKAYLNIHSSEFRGGEIRTFLTRVPDAAATAPLLALGMLALFGCGRMIRARAG